MQCSRMSSIRNVFHPLRCSNRVKSTAYFSTSLSTNAQVDEPNYRRLILESRVYDVAVKSPLQRAPSLSHTTQNNIYFKREDLQPVFSFKLRGGYNKMACLTDEQKAAGVVCCSAGNHAQGVALAARKLKLNATIVMPLATPEIKIRSVRQHGQEWVTIVLHGKTYDEAAAEANRLQVAEKRTMVLPFDDPYVIAGQGTIGMEILQQIRHVDAIFVACGGGGVLAGIAAWVKAIRPQVKVIGVEAADAPGMTASLEAGELLTLDHVGIFADGAAVRRVGEETFRVCQEYVDEMITVSTNEICAAIKSGFNDTRAILEPAGALGIAGCKKYIHDRGITGATLVAVTSGANIDFSRLRFVSERADSNETLISVTLDEKPGAFRRLHQHLDSVGVQVTEFSYRYSDKHKGVLYLSFRSPNSNTTLATTALQHLTAVGYDVMDLTTNELAQCHTRHLAGGRPKSSTESHEKLHRFEFPDRPGALRLFLESLGTRWNISLFHYRNHGADVGRVLVGFQVAPNDERSFEEFLAQLPFSSEDESENSVYKQFLV